MGDVDALVVGAGPAGLTAAYELAKRGYAPLVVEKSDQVGGISRTETYKGYRFDIGGHRFFTKVGEVERLWHEILQDEFVRRPRMSRIYYDGKFFPYPLKIAPTLANLGPLESLRIMGSYLWARLVPKREPANLEEWVTNRFGDRLYRTFFKTYTEKVWGIPCTEIRADWAAQRIKGLSLTGAVVQALTGRSSETSLIESFHYPIHGPGMMWERCTERVEGMGGQVLLDTEAIRIEHEPTTEGRRRVSAVHVGSGAAATRLRPAEVINSMPINHLIERLDPPPPPEVVAAARSLSYRDFLIVALIIKQKDLFPDNWIYVHSPEVQVGRIQNFKNWSEEMVPDSSMTCLGMEYFCNRGDDLWEMDRDSLVALASEELERIGLARKEDVVDGTIIFQPMAYPVYDADYQDHLETIRGYLETFENLQTTGRAGMHRYNNQDHSMLTAILAAKNIAGELAPNGQRHDLWSVNVERSYHEEFTVDETRAESKEKERALAA